MKAMKEERRKASVFEVESKKPYEITDDDEYDRMGLNKEYVDTFYKVSDELRAGITEDGRIPVLKSYGIDTSFFDAKRLNVKSFVNKLNLFCESVPDRFFRTDTEDAVKARQEILLKSVGMDMTKKERIIMLEKAGFPDYALRLEILGKEEV